MLRHFSKQKRNLFIWLSLPSLETPKVFSKTGDFRGAPNKRNITHPCRLDDLNVPRTTMFF